MLDDALELSAYRIVQEAVTNVVRHAGATRAQVGIAMQGDTLTLTIADNGIGAETLVREGHYGVRGMQERTESHGGSIRFQAGAEGGLEVQVRLPVASHGESTDGVIGSLGQAGDAEAAVGATGTGGAGGAGGTGSEGGYRGKREGSNA